MTKWFSRPDTGIIDQVFGFKVVCAFQHKIIIRYQLYDILFCDGYGIRDNVHVGIQSFQTFSPGIHL